jgi:predicted permease
MDLHLEQLTKEYIAAGMTESEARLAARREFGPAAATKEQCRDMRRVNLIDDLSRDLVYTCRVLMRSPGFAITAVLSLALGIGANTAIFSIVDAVLLRMLPVHEPQQLVEVSREGGRTLSYPMFEIIRDRNEVFSGVLLTSSGRFAASARLGSTDLGDVHFSPVSGDYFSVLGISPVIGRALSEQDLTTANAVVISYGFWQRAFAGDPAVLGKTLSLGSRAYEIVGIAPAAFTGLATGHPVDLWVPVTFWADRGVFQNPVAMMFRVVARRKPGVSEERAWANMQLLSRQWSTEWKFEQPMRVEVAAASGGLTQLRRRFSRPLLVLMTIVVLLLLIAALNIANLLLARACARQREIAVRLSLGASRARLIRQFLTESLVLGGMSGILGLLVAPGAAAFLVHFLSSSMGTVELSFGIDMRVLSFTLFTSMAVVLLFGLAPALAATRFDVSPAFRRDSLSGRLKGGTGPQKLLVVAQVAISCVLLVGALLFARSLETLSRVDAGFQPENVLLIRAQTSEGGPTGVERVRLYERVLERLPGVPGVRSAALSSERLFSGNTWTEAVNAPTFAPHPGQDREAVLLVVSPGFFRTMRTAMLLGRDFDTRDSEKAPRVAIVNEAAARYYFGTTDAVGQTFRLEHNSFPEPLTVVGLVRDAKYKSLREAAPRIVYLPALQTPGPLAGANIAIRVAANPERMRDLIWEEIQAESPYLRFGGATIQADVVNGTIAQDRMLAQLSSFFGLAAAALVCLGLYGLTAYEVSRRTAEIGIRIALGAQTKNVLRVVLIRSLMLVGSGVALGLAGSVAVARFIETLLFGVGGTDAVTLFAATALLLSIGAGAAYWPARKAARLDPIAALKYE